MDPNGEWLHLIFRIDIRGRTVEGNANAYQGTILQREMIRELIGYVTRDSVVPSQSTIIGRGSGKDFDRGVIKKLAEGPDFLFTH